MTYFFLCFAFGDLVFEHQRDEFMLFVSHYYNVDLLHDNIVHVLRQGYYYNTAQLFDNVIKWKVYKKNHCHKSNRKTQPKTSVLT